MKIAIVGCGQIADAHIEESRKIPGVYVAGVCDMNLRMAEQAARRYAIPAVYTDLDRMLEEIKPDVVHVTAPPQAHASIARRVLDRGVHAYIEKPFTVNVAEADELVALAAQRQKLICVGHSNALDSSFLRLRNLSEQGALGEIVHVDAFMSYDLSGSFGKAFMGDPTHWLHTLPGGLAQNNISHPLSLILPFLEDKHPEVRANGFRWRKQKYGDVRDRFFDELRVMILGKQTTAQLVFSCRARPVQLCVVAYGTERQGAVSLDARTLQIVEGASLPGPFAKLQWAYRAARQAKQEHRRHLKNLFLSRLHYFEGMRELFRRFYLAIDGAGEMPVPMSEALRITAIMEEIFRQCCLQDKQGELERA